MFWDNFLEVKPSVCQQTEGLSQLPDILQVGEILSDRINQESFNLGSGDLHLPELETFEDPAADQIPHPGLTCVQYPCCLMYGQYKFILNPEFLDATGFLLSFLHFPFGK